MNQNPEISRKGINRKLLDEMVFDLRIVLSWDADNCDMDLWITAWGLEFNYRGTKEKMMTYSIDKQQIVSHSIKNEYEWDENDI